MTKDVFQRFCVLLSRSFTIVNISTVEMQKNKIYKPWSSLWFPISAEQLLAAFILQVLLLEGHMFRQILLELRRFLKVVHHLCCTARDSLVACSAIYLTHTLLYALSH
jgi:hypothetical protein